MALPVHIAAVRIARPTGDIVRAVSFYRDAGGLRLLASFEDHDGYSGAILGVPDASVQLELVFHAEVDPFPTEEDQLVLYLGSADEVAARAAAIGAAGGEETTAGNPYWARVGAVAYVDPDGYRLILSPQPGRAASAESER